MLEFLKIRNVKSPERDASENAGIDFFIPNIDAYTDDELHKFGENVTVDKNNGAITILPHGDLLLPCGIKCKFPNNIVLIAFNKSGIASKKKLVVGSCIVDSSYQGELFIHVINTSNMPQTIEFGQKLVQIVPVPIITDDLIIYDGITTDEFYEGIKSKRGEGALGSSGIK